MGFEEMYYGSRSKVKKKVIPKIVGGGFEYDSTFMSALFWFRVDFLF